MPVPPEARSARRRFPNALRCVTAAGLVAAAGVGFLGCGSARQTNAPAAAAAAAIPAKPVLDASGQLAGIENYRRWSDKLGQGGQPVGEIAFANLAALGYRTVLSVDGLPPDVETAAKHGLRYVHVPFGYDGVPKEAQTRIVKAVKATEGPVFLHCHHGVARGPAGAMIARIAVDGITNVEAAQELKQSGCSDRYKGLFRDVLAAVPPTPEELASVPQELPSRVSLGALADQMASLDRTWARIGAAKTASWTAPANRPDVDPAHEARMLWEKLRELGRLGDVESHGPDFLTTLLHAEESGHALEDALVNGDKTGAEKHFGVIKQTCDSCHARWRDSR
jgi:protein tyrosine phosphatase (PTP) superfamily phosphohydrolase (DUF442 family)